MQDKLFQKETIRWKTKSVDIIVYCIIWQKHLFENPYYKYFVNIIQLSNNQLAYISQNHRYEGLTLQNVSCQWKPEKQCRGIFYNSSPLYYLNTDPHLSTTGVGSDNKYLLNTEYVLQVNSRDLLNKDINIYSCLKNWHRTYIKILITPRPLHC